jgi:hypothetical protein
VSGAASRRDHVKFCQTEGWTEVRNARGQHVRHHITYELALGSGAILRTRISRPANSDQYGPRLWSTILADQLCVTEDEFWSCVRRGVLPVREAPAPILPSNALPASLAYQLIHDAGIPEHDVAQLNLDEALAIMREHWSRPPDDP